MPTSSMPRPVYPAGEQPIEGVASARAGRRHARQRPSLGLRGRRARTNLRNARTGARWRSGRHTSSASAPATSPNGRPAWPTRSPPCAASESRHERGSTGDQHDEQRLAAMRRARRRHPPAPTGFVGSDVRGKLTPDAPLAKLVWFKSGGTADWLFEPGRPRRPAATSLAGCRRARRSWRSASAPT